MLGARGLLVLWHVVVLSLCAVVFSPGLEGCA
jgi:hypothetical protein